jgi:hypothetical protein
MNDAFPITRGAIVRIRSVAVAARLRSWRSSLFRISVERSSREERHRAAGTPSGHDTFEPRDPVRRSPRAIHVSCSAVHWRRVTCRRRVRIPLDPASGYAAVG